MKLQQRIEQLERLIDDKQSKGIDTRRLESDLKVAKRDLIRQQGKQLEEMNHDCSDD